MQLFFLPFIIYAAFYPNATIYRVYTVDTMRASYDRSGSTFEPWVMEDFVDKLNDVCEKNNLGFKYEFVQEPNPPPWQGVDVSVFVTNTSKFDAVITNPVAGLMQWGLVPYFHNFQSNIPIIASSMGFNSPSQYENPPANMFFPTPSIANIYDRLIPLFQELGMKKHVIIWPEACEYLVLFPILEETKKRLWGGENYKCVNPRNMNMTCNKTYEEGFCLRPFDEIVEEIGDADVVEFFEYSGIEAFVEYIHEKKIDYKVKIFVSQLDFDQRYLNLDKVMYGLIEQRGFSSSTSYHQSYDDGKNYIGIFAATENKTSQQIFDEWFYGISSSSFKLSVIGEIIGWYYLHHNILLPREMNVDDLSEVMR